MKIHLILFSLFLTLTSNAQHFGKTINADQALMATEVKSAMADQESMTLKVKGVIQEVCQAKGCWMTMEIGNNHNMRITFKDYGFFVPKDASGKSAVIEGILKKEVVSVATLKHFAQDAGKSQQQIDAITEPQTDLVFVAEGVLLLN